MIRNVFLILLLSLAIACGKEDEDSSSGGGVVNALTVASSTANEKAGKVKNLSPTAESFHAQQARFPMAASSFGSNWTTNAPGLVDERTNTTTNPKVWMGLQLSEDAARANGSKISMLGRLKDALNNFCAVGVGSGNISGGGYPENGTHSVTLDSSMVAAIESQCEMDIESSMEGSTISLTLEQPGDTTYYDKKITISLPRGDQVFYVRSNSSEINIATSEVNTHLHRTVVAYDVASKTMRLEYISAPDETLSGSGKHLSAYRLYYDETNDVGYMMSIEYSDGGEETKYLLAGKPDASGAKFSLSFMSSAVGSGTEYQACVAASTGSIDTDGSFCSNTSSSITGKSVSGTAAANLPSGFTYTDYRSVSATTTLSFDNTDIDSASYSTN